MRTILKVYLLLLVVGCSDDSVPRPPNFVVEAFITGNEPIDNIRIKGTTPIDSVNVSNEPIGEAEVVINGPNNQVILDYNPLTGLYEDTGELVEVSIGQPYSLEVTLGERTATSTTVVPDPPVNVRLPDSVLTIPQLRLSFSLGDQINDLFFNERITLQWDSIPGQTYFVVIESRVVEQDTILPLGIPSEAQELLSSFRFISEPSSDTSFEIIGIALDTYGPHVAKVFTVNEEYVDLFNNLEQDSRDLNEPPSNVDNAQGIFTAFAVDSALFTVRRP